MDEESVVRRRRRRLALAAVVALGAAWLGLSAVYLAGFSTAAGEVAPVAFGLALVAAGIGAVTAFGPGERTRRAGGALFIAGADGVRLAADLAILFALLLVFYAQVGAKGDSTPG